MEVEEDDDEEMAEEIEELDISLLIDEGSAFDCCDYDDIDCSAKAFDEFNDEIDGNGGKVY